MDDDHAECIPMHEEAYADSRYLAIFRECDKDKDGYISLDELENFVNGHQEECCFISRRILQKIHDQADGNGDAKLDFDEFVQLLQSKDFLYIFHKCVTTYVHHLIPHPKKEVGPFQLRSARISAEEEPNLCNEYSCFPPPIFMFLISLLEFALFLTDESTQKDSSLTGSGVTARYLLYDPEKKKEAWRFLTYMFVHIGYNHIITNLIVQLALGIPLEMVNKWWRVLTIYFLGGIAGCLAHSIIDGNVKLGGASGGVYALMTAHLAQVIMNWDSLKFATIQLLIFGLIIFVDLGTAAYQRYYLHIVNNIGVTCHLGGAIAGLLVGIYVLRNLYVTKTEEYIWWGALILYIVLTLTAIIATFMS